MQPTRSYVIWFSQRTGSTLLAKTLELTGLAGNAQEWLNPAPGQSLLDELGADDAAGFRDAVWREGTSANGVLGVKYGMLAANHEKVTALFRQLPGCSETGNPSELWEAVFPNCKHIYMTRRNKVRLAISWWKAIRTDEWHRVRGDQPKDADVRDQYVFEAIDHLFVEAAMREAAIQEHFDACGIVPMTVVYEDFIASYEATVHAVLDHLEIETATDFAVPEPAYERLADPIAEEWVQRYREERQTDGMNAW